MIAHLLANTEVADVLKLCSPSLFKVLSVREVMGQVQALSASRSETRHQTLVNAHGRVHLNYGVHGGAQAALGRPLEQHTFVQLGDAKHIGEAALRLYFRELFHFDETLIDFRASGMRVNDSNLGWTPAPMSVEWNRDFIRNLRSVYEGFYCDDDVRFRSALQALSLLPAEQLFRKHFGEGDQHAVVFSTRTFTRTFGAVFETCANAGSKLHANFLPFGFMLASLFQTLEQLGCAFDVRAAFHTALTEHA
jgi:hypothetical protein